MSESYETLKFFPWRMIWTSHLTCKIS